MSNVIPRDSVPKLKQLHLLSMQWLVEQDATSEIKENI